MDECIAAPTDRLIVLEEEDPDEGYGQLTHIKAFMYFPADGEARQRYVDSLLHQGSALYLTDTAMCPDSGIYLSEEQHRVLRQAAEIEWNEVQEIRAKTSGFLAAECLHFFLSALTHHAGGNRKTKLPSVVNWQNIMKVRKADEFSRNRFPLRLSSEKNSDFPTDQNSLRQVRLAFMPVAHFWAAYFDRNARERGLFTNERLDEFIALAEAYRIKAEELDVYEHAKVGSEKAVPYRIGTSDGETVKPVTALDCSALPIDPIGDDIWDKIGKKPKAKNTSKKRRD